MRKSLIFVLLLIILTFPYITFSIEIDFQSKIKLSEKVLLQLPISFCVTEDESFLVVDFKAGDVKIFNNKGALEKVLGRRGAGPNEFLQPLFCDYNNRKFIVPDVGQRKIFFYDKVGKFKFERTGEIYYANIGEDIQLKENRIYMSCNKISEDKKYYSFYSFDLDEKGNHTYFLPTYLKFGLASENEYKTEYLKKPDLTTIGVMGRFDIHRNFIQICLSPKNGNNFSVGERQRIVLCSAFYRDTHLIVFDEPTSAIDYEGTRRIIDSIKKIPGDRTVIIATHNRDLLECGDRLISIENGRIIGNKVLRNGGEEVEVQTLKNETREVFGKPLGETHRIK